MANKTATQVLLKQHVDHGEVLPEHFQVKTAEVDMDNLSDGSIAVQLLFTSVDPYLRTRMKSGKGYLMPAYALDKPLDSPGLARVVKSSNPGFTEGDVVSGMLPWQSLVVLPSEAAAHVHKIQNAAGLPLSYFLNVLGMTGLTAYASLKRIGKPKAGETVFVSGAAGAVGYVVGQLCKNVYGTRVVGSAGSDEKVEFLKRLGFDAAWNYKTTSTREALQQHCPDGIDVYFDNVGGETLEAALEQCNAFARVVACGMISQYNKAPQEMYGVKNLFLIVGKRILVQGFLVGDYMEDFGEFITSMSDYVSSGKVQAVEHVVEGLEQAGQAFADMMRGVNIGKALVKVAE